MVSKDYYRLLTEGLERKYAPAKLNEAWSDSMPSWLKKRLSEIGFTDKFKKSSRWDRGPAIGKAFKELETYPRFKRAYDSYIDNGFTHEDAVAAVLKDMGFKYEPLDYVKPRGATYAEKEAAGRNIFQQFYDVHHIDLQKAEFIESEPPKSARHPAFNDGNIPIWFIHSTNQIYAKGINDNEVLNGASGSSYAGKAFRYVPLKELAELCEGDFCYIDGTTIDKDAIPEKKSDRALRKDWEKSSRWTRGTPGETVTMTMPDTYKDITVTRDKSGYFVIPSAAKYAKILEKSRAKNYATTLSKVEAELRRYYALLINAPRLSTWDNPDFAQGFQTQYKNALDSYKALLQTIDRIVSAYGEDSEEFIEYLTSDYDWSKHFGDIYANPFKRQMRILRSKLRDVEQSASDYDFVPLDI